MFHVGNLHETQTSEEEYANRKNLSRNSCIRSYRPGVSIPRDGRPPEEGGQLGISTQDFTSNLDSNGLETWEALTQDQRDEIMRTVNNPDFTSVGMTQEEATQISPHLKVEVTEQPQGTAPSAMMRSASANKSSTYRESTKQFGIEMGWTQIDYNYSTSGGKVVSDTSCVASYNNIVPLRTINYQTDKWISNGKGNCISNWSVSRAWGLAGTDNWEHGMTVNGNGDISNRWYFKK